MAETIPAETALRLRRVFAAPRQRVFDAWTRPEELKRWCAPSEDYSTPIAEIDLRVGGRYRIGMKSPDGNLYVVTGTYREVQPPEKLVYTWSWEGGEMGETLVTVEFREVEGATELVLTHELFPDTKAREDHEQGWTGCLERLGRLVSP